jgi:hypothetical protein
MNVQVVVKHNERGSIMQEVKTIIVTEKEWDEYVEYNKDPLVLSEDFFDNIEAGDTKWIICYSEDKQIKHFDTISYLGSPPTMYEIDKVLKTIFKDDNISLTRQEIKSIGNANILKNWK